MKSRFKLNAETTVEVETNKPSRMVAILLHLGVDFDENPANRKPTAQLWLTKSQARAIASAIMGCAAEV